MTTQVQAIYRGAAYIVTDDDLPPADSTMIVAQGTGMKTPAVSTWLSDGLQRIDATATVIAYPLLAANGTYSLPVANLTARTLLRIQGGSKFSVAITPHGGAAQTLNFAGSAYMPGLCELTLTQCDAVLLTNTSGDIAGFVVAAATVVDYNDPSIPAVTR